MSPNSMRKMAQNFNSKVNYRLFKQDGYYNKDTVSLMAKLRKGKKK